MNIQNFLKQDIQAQIQKACEFGLRLHFLATDLRTFANAIKSSKLEDLEKYAWYKQHFGGGFPAGPDYKTATNSGNYNHFGFCIRESQSSVLNLTQKSGNSGADLITGFAMAKMLQKGLGGLTTEQFSTSEDDFHCEHNFQVNHLEKLLKQKVLVSNKIDPVSLMRFVIDHSLVVTVHNSERKDGGDNENHNISPFWRYEVVGANVLQYTDSGFEDVTKATIQEVNSNRWFRNTYFKNFREAFENIAQKDLDAVKTKVYNSAYMKEAHSNCSPILNDANLEILLRNDFTEIATTFYPDKFKDRWKKAQ